MDWAHNHKAFRLVGAVEFNDGSGPEHCGNCAAYGSIRGVFVGYCSNCLRNYIDTNEPRGRLVALGTSIDMVDNDTIWQEYPYMYGIPKSEIGDEEGVEATDDGVSLEELGQLRAAEEAEEAQDNHSAVDEEEEQEEEEEEDARRYDYYDDYNMERAMSIEELGLDHDEEPFVITEMIM
jgi:hypothetical protein